ncbi:MAG: polysaccharide deacetylase family protein, partial [bacterium]
MMIAKTHWLTLSFDDGFATSFRLAADIAEEFGVKANLNIIASGCEPGFVPADEYHNSPVGGWDLWNELAARGHEIGMHSWDHANHAKEPLETVLQKIDRCLEAFERNLKGFKRSEAVYYFPYNSSTPAVEAYLSSQVRAYRTGGTGFNEPPSAASRRLHCTAHGPGNCEAHLDGCVERWLKSPGGWLIYNTHGYDAEGWGPITPDYNRKLYAR